MNEWLSINVFVHFMCQGMFFPYVSLIYSCFGKESAKLKYTKSKAMETMLIVVNERVCWLARWERGWWSDL